MSRGGCKGDLTQFGGAVGGGVVIAYGVGISVGGGGVDNRGKAVMNGGGGV